MVFTDLLHFELRQGRAAHVDAKAWRDSFNHVREGHRGSADPIYSDAVYQMLEAATQATAARHALEYHARIQLFRVLFAYIRPEL